MRIKKPPLPAWVLGAFALIALSGGTAKANWPFDDRLSRADSLIQVRSLGPALAILDSLLLDARRSESREEELQVLLAQTRIHVFAGRPGQARASAASGLRIASSMNDTLSICKALRWLTVAAQSEGEMREARVLAERLLLLARLRADRLHEGHGNLLLGYDDLLRGNIDAAEVEYERAVLLLGESGDRRFELMALTGLGRVLDSRGEIPGARRRYLEVLEGCRAIGDSYGEAHALNNLGVLEFTYGDPSSAQDFYSQALRLQMSKGNPEGSIVPATNLAMTQTYMGEFDLAIQVLDEAKRLCDERGYRGQKALVLEQMGAVRKTQGRVGEAAALYRQALTNASEGSADVLGAILVGLAGTLALRDSVEAAIAILQDRFDPIEHLAPPMIVDLAERLRGETLFRLGRFDEALERFRIAEWNGKTHQLPFRVHPLVYSARCYDAIAQTDSARIYLGRAVTAWESERQRIRDPQWREQLQLDGRLLYSELAGHHLSDTTVGSEEEQARAAFDALQRFKARTLRERMLGAFASGSEPSVEPISAPVTLADLQDSILGPDDLLLDIFIGVDGIYLFGVTREECRAIRIAHDIRLLQEMLERYRDLVANRPEHSQSEREKRFIAEAGHSLSRLLLAPVGDLLRQAARIVLVPDGFLNMIPVEALPLPLGASERHSPEPLNLRIQVARIPSASMLRDQRLHMRRASLPVPPVPPAPTAPPTPPATILAILGEPDSGAPALPGAEDETRWLQRTFRGVQTRRAGGGHNPSAWISEPVQFDILHLASHIRVDDRQPWRSGLPQLRAHEIASMDLRSRLAVLAGCESAGGRVVSGEGVLGLTAAFTAAGIPSIVATLWPVSDRATTRFMKVFYGSLQSGETVGEALGTAQRAIRETPGTSHPFYWAGFILVGESDAVLPLERKGGPFSPPFLRAVVAAMIGGIGGLWWYEKRRSR